MNNPDHINLLLEQVKQVSNLSMSTPRDFAALSERLGTMGNPLSPSTLKRLWGYIPQENVSPRTFTLTVLSQYLGYKDFDHFVASHGECNDAASNPVMGMSLHATQSLVKNDRLQLTWQPGRLCVIRYLGNAEWVVEYSERTRLLVGNTFECDLFIEGEPLYIDNLVQTNRLPTSYVCGTRGGIHFVKLPTPGND